VGTSLFRRVTRYSVNPAADPAENRLTEVTAGVLEHVPLLRYEIALKLARLACGQTDLAYCPAEVERRADILNRLRGLAPARVRVATQRATGGGKFVDLELLVRANGQRGRGVLMWVEVKHGADLHGTQLQDYLNDIRTVAAVGGDETLVVLLAPRTAMPACKLPDEVAIAEWEDISRFVAGQASCMPRSDPQRWILEQYTAYLEEEALIDPPALTAGHAFTLAEEGAATKPFAASARKRTPTSSNAGRLVRRITQRTSEPATGPSTPRGSTTIGQVTGSNGACVERERSSTSMTMLAGQRGSSQPG